MNDLPNGNTDAPKAIRYEFHRACAFCATFGMFSEIGVSEDLLKGFLAPYELTISQYLDAYPSLEPVIMENPADVIRPDLKRMGLLDFPGFEDGLETVRRFFEENPSQLPMTLELNGDE